MNARVIILIDLSEDSENLLRFARTVAKNSGAEFILLHRMDIPIPTLTEPKHKQSIREEEAERVLGILKKMVDANLGNVPVVKYHITHENITHSISKLRSEKSPNYLFLGMKENGILKKLFLGNTTIKVIDHSLDPVYAVPKFSIGGDVSTLYIGVDQKFDVNLKVLQEIINFSLPGIRQLVFFSIIRHSDETKTNLDHLGSLTEKLSKNFDISCRVYIAKDVLQGIKLFMKDADNSILVVQRGSRMFTDHIGRNFLINELVNDASMPILVLP